MVVSEKAQPSARQTVFSRILWGIWPLVNWALTPVLIGVYAFSDSAGWDGLFMVLFSPLIIPAAGLLGSLPRFIMRKRGFTWVPAGVQMLFAVHWCSAVYLMLTLRGVGDSGSKDSMLDKVFEFSNYAVETLMFLSITCIALAWCAQVVWASCAPSPHKASVRAQRPAAVLFGGLSFVIIPLLFVGLSVLTQGAVRLRNEFALKQPDLSGIAAAEAKAITDPEHIRARHENAWDEAQAQVSPVREAMSDEHWTPYSRTSNGIDYSFTSGTYTVGVEWVLKLEMSTKQLHDEATAAVTANGWNISESGQDNTLFWLRAVNDSGYRITIEIHPAREVDDGVALMRITLVSPEYWPEGDNSDWSGYHDVSEVYALFGRDEDGPTQQSEFTAEEWPPPLTCNDSLELTRIVILDRRGACQRGIQSR